MKKYATSQHNTSLLASLLTPLAFAFVVGFVAILSMSNVSAQTQTVQTPTDLDDVIVTGTRTEVSLSQSLVPAQVIQREDIERSQARTLTDLLRGRAGISVGDQGGVGKLSTVFLRGSESDHVLLLIDGVRIGSATAGQAALQDLPIDQIDRIEIVRGPRSSLYGSEAIGGVVQIFTRRDSGKVLPRFRTGASTQNTREASVGIGGGIGRGWFGADVAYQRTDGINACRGTAFSPEAPFGAGCYVDEPDRDGYENRSLNIRGGANLTEAIAFEASALRADSDNAFDGSVLGGNEAENVQQVISAKLAFAPTDAFKLNLQIGRNDDASDNYYSDAIANTRSFVGNFDTHREVASAQADYDIAAGHILSAGVDWQHDEIESNTPFDIASRDNRAGFIEYQGALGAYRMQASVRNDDNQQFGDHTTGNAGLGWSFADNWQLKMSAGTGFKAPSFNDLYYPFFGNSNLRPERSRSFNIGVSQQTETMTLTFDAYETKVEDLISYDAAMFLPNNIEEARIRGAELTVDTLIAGWDASAQLSHTDPRNRTAGRNDGNTLARRPKNSGRVDLDRRFGAFRIGSTLNAAGARYDDAANSVRLGGYATWDLRMEYTLAPAWTLQARADNVLDRTYETVDWYYQPGREYGLSLRYAPEH